MLKTKGHAKDFRKAAYYDKIDINLTGSKRT
jgi:hypothetical protein